MDVRFVLFVSVGLQLAAAVLALRLVWVTGKRLAWGMISAAILLMAVRRFITLAATFWRADAAPPDMGVELVALVISVLMLLGVARIAPLFAAAARSEAELHESQRALASLMSNLPGMAYRCRNDRDWTMEYVSEGCRGLTGYGPEDLVANRAVAYNDLIVPEHREEVWREVERAVAAREPFRLVYRIRTACGAEKWVWEQGRAVFDESGRAATLEGFITDVTERRQAEEVLHKAREELEERVKERTAELTRANDDLAQFAYSASHDLQEPLRMMGAYLRTLDGKLRGQLDPQSQTLLDLSLDAGQRMQRLINDLLAYSRVGTRGKHFEVLDANRVVDRAVEDLHEAIRAAGARVARGDLPRVTADATLLGQLFQNLIGNAVKFRRNGQAPRVRVDCEDAGSEWRFSVRDDGIGIDPRHLDRIFVVFERLHPQEKYPGTGIGLAICKRAVERHGGRIWCESTPGQGSTFYFTLPKEPTAACPAPNPREETRR